MPVEVDLVHFLDANLAEVSGTDLFEGEPGEEPAAAIFVAHYSGEAGEDRVMSESPSVPGIEVVHVQVTARNADRATARARAVAVHTLLDGLHGQDLGPSARKYFEIQSMDSEPYSLGQDKLARWRFVCHFRARKARG